MSIRNFGENAKKMIRVKGLKMPGILKRSPLYSVCFNVIWLVLESIFALIGFIPLHITLNGGECSQHVGLYWCITYLYPMTIAGEQHSAPAPVRDFSFLRFLLAIAVFTVIFFIILLIANKYIKHLLIFIGAVTAVIASVIGIKKAIKIYNDTPMELYRIEVLSADIHPGVCNTMNYPNHAYYLVPAGTDGNRYGYLDSKTFENAIAPENVTREQLNALLDAAKAVRDNRNDNYKGDFAFRIEITYKTRDGYGSVSCRCYDEFPEEWAEFARRVNEICGGEYLREDPELVKYSDDWFGETYGIYEKDLPEGASLTDFREYGLYDMDMQTFCGSRNGEIHSFDAEKEMNNYLDYLSRLNGLNAEN